ncbi:hypothetical protein PINS_up021864 [Pythium insidiosum]|nr:hypothetical protein PINS_up021864 [Pythium insidiosum]
MATLQHERIIQFVGVAWVDPLDVHVVTEFMDGGDLRTLLQTFDSQGRPVGFGRLQAADRTARDRGTRVPPLATACGAASRPQVTQRAAVGGRTTRQAHRLWCLAATRRSEQQHDDHLVVGTLLRWMAPEVMVGGALRESADVFSFGVVLSELDTHEIPYNVGGESMPDGAIILLVTEGNLQSDAEVVRLARDCMAHEPQQRPSAADVASPLARDCAALLADGQP